MIMNIARDEISFFLTVADLINELPRHVPATSTLRCVVVNRRSFLLLPAAAAAAPPEPRCAQAFTLLDVDTFEYFYAKATDLERKYTVPFFLLSFIVDKRFMKG